MRFLLTRTDALGDLVISLPVMERILSRDPEAEIHWLVRPYAAPLLEGVPGSAGVHLRDDATDLTKLFKDVKPDAVLNLSHRDRAVTVVAKKAGVPVRVARARGMDQILAATHVLWRGRKGSRRHEAQNALDFLAPWGWDGGLPAYPHLVLRDNERVLAEQELSPFPRPRLGIILRGSGAGAFPTDAWWERAKARIHDDGWSSVVLSPPEASVLPGASLRILMARIAACDAVISPSTGPAHIAAALRVPLLCLMGLRVHHSPDRWQPHGESVQVLQYPGPEADLEGGMDRLDPVDLLPHLRRLR